jgi:hypothetical protein
MRASRRVACAVLAGSLLSRTAAAYVNLPDLPAPYPSVIQPDQILDAYRQGEFGYGWRLLRDFAYQEIRQALNDEKLIPSLVVKAAGKLQEILNDPGKTERQKGQEVLKEIELSMEPYESAPAGGLGLSLKHSIEYGVTRLSWSHRREVDECRGGFCGWRAVCYTDSWGVYRCDGREWYCDAWIDYVLKEPDYTVYRTVNGQETPVTKLKGRQVVHRESIRLSGDLWKTIKSILDADWGFEFRLGSDKAFIHDPLSDHRNVGDSLAYRVVSNNSAYRLGQCGSSETHTSTATADQDADGRMDFIPSEAYDNFVGTVGNVTVPGLGLPGQPYAVAWPAASGNVAYYELQQAADAAFTSPMAFSPGLATSLEIAQPSGVYHYRVRGCNSAACGGWRAAAGPVHVTFPPSASAGADQAVNASHPVRLSGSGSDADGAIARYTWSQTAGPAVSLAGAGTASPTFTAPAVTADAVLSFRLVVTDNDGATGAASVSVVVRAPLPIPNVRPLYRVCSVYNPSSCAAQTTPGGPYTLTSVLGYVPNAPQAGTLSLYQVCSVYNLTACSVQAAPGGTYTVSTLIAHAFTAPRVGTIPLYNVCSVYNTASCNLQTSPGGAYTLTSLLGHLYASNTLPAI